MSAAAAPKLFISYRREGTAMHAGRLYDAMAARFGEPNVFMDLELAPGVDFVERITTAVGACRVLLVVIGPQWAGDRDGRSRIADPADFVRLEVETALRAADVTVIPVLVEGARMPAPEELPPELRPLARRNAIELSDLRWRYDCQRLMAALDELLGGQAPDAGPVPPPAPRPSIATLVPLWLEGVAVATAAGLIVRQLAGPLKAAKGAEDSEQIVSAILLRGISWAAVGAALAIWLAVRRGRGRLLRRTATGLLLGALAGVLGGALFGLVAYLPATNLDPDARDRLNIAALALTGGILGIALGALWTPRRVAAGCVGGALGGALVQLATYGTETKLGDPWTFGLNCCVIVGVALFAMLALDVRDAAVARRAALPPDTALEAAGA